MQKSEVRDQRSEGRGQRTEGSGEKATLSFRYSSSAVRRLSSVVCLSRGQAMVEFMVSLVVILVLLAGLIQIGRLTHAHTRVMSAARAQAGRLAVALAPPVSETALFISDWLPGRDERRYTDDDIAVIHSNSAALPGDIAGRARLELLPALPANALSTLSDPSNPGVNLFLVKGASSEVVPILPVIRRLVFARSELEVQSEAWLTWTEGIY